jgi:L-cysteine desulfidase
MRFSEFLALEWRPALGCTEPASIAFAAASAARAVGGRVVSAHLLCDARMYKNCYAVGIPHSGGRTGILASLAIGSLLPDPDAGLECFRQIEAAHLEEADRLLASGVVTVDVDRASQELLVDCRVVTTAGVGRARIEREHTRLVQLQRDGVDLPLPAGDAAGPPPAGPTRAALAARSFDELVALAESLDDADAELLRRGVAWNQAIARHGLSLFPEDFVGRMGGELQARLALLVLAGVYARMSGEDFVVMSLSGSGNKGITCSVPLSLYAEERDVDQGRVDRALALALLVTSATTWHLGTLSAVCGCSNAAGIGLAAGLVYLDGGDPASINLAMNNMVGNVAGMICDGAKIGCAMKTMTSVDAAFRSARLALCGMGIPASDGIVGRDGVASLQNLGRVATRGMAATDPEILSIMQEKLRGARG